MGKRSIPANLGGIIIIDTAAFMQREANMPMVYVKQFYYTLKQFYNLHLKQYLSSPLVVGETHL